MTGAVVFNKPLTAMNWLGIAVALGGVLWYSFLDNHYSKSKAVETVRVSVSKVKSAASEEATVQSKDSQASTETEVSRKDCRISLGATAGGITQSESEMRRRSNCQQ